MYNRQTEPQYSFQQLVTLIQFVSQDVAARILLSYEKNVKTPTLLEWWKQCAYIHQRQQMLVRDVALLFLMQLMISTVYFMRFLPVVWEIHQIPAH